VGVLDYYSDWQYLAVRNVADSGTFVATTLVKVKFQSNVGLEAFANLLNSSTLYGSIISKSPNYLYIMDATDPKVAYQLKFPAFTNDKSAVADVFIPIQAPKVKLSLSLVVCNWKAKAWSHRFRALLNEE